jgi:hypothetical protein
MKALFFFLIVGLLAAGKMSSNLEGDTGEPHESEKGEGSKNPSGGHAGRRPRPLLTRQNGTRNLLEPSSAVAKSSGEAEPAKDDTAQGNEGSK